MAEYHLHQIAKEFKPTSKNMHEFHGITSNIPLAKHQPTEHEARESSSSSFLKSRQWGSMDETTLFSSPLPFHYFITNLLFYYF